MNVEGINICSESGATIIGEAAADVNTGGSINIGVIVLFNVGKLPAETIFLLSKKSSCLTGTSSVPESAAETGAAELTSVDDNQGGGSKIADGISIGTGRLFAEAGTGVDPATPCGTDAVESAVLVSDVDDSQGGGSINMGESSGAIVVGTVELVALVAGADCNCSLQFSEALACDIL